LGQITIFRPPSREPYRIRTISVPIRLSGALAFFRVLQYSLYALTLSLTLSPSLFTFFWCLYHVVSASRLHYIRAHLCLDMFCASTPPCAYTQRSVCLFPSMGYMLFSAICFPKCLVPVTRCAAVVLCACHISRRPSLVTRTWTSAGYGVSLWHRARDSAWGLHHRSECAARLHWQCCLKYI